MSQLPAAAPLAPGRLTVTPRYHPETPVPRAGSTITAMNQDPVADPADRPLMPPELDSGMGALRWVITGIALVLLVVGAWRGYMWFIDDVAKRIERL